MRRRHLRLDTLATLWAAIGTTGAALAQGWPPRPIRLVVPFPAGGAADLLDRCLSQRLGAQRGWSEGVVVDNQVDAVTRGGAADVAARVQADRHRGGRLARERRISVA